MIDQLFGETMTLRKEAQAEQVKKRIPVKYIPSQHKFVQAKAVYFDGTELWIARPELIKLWREEPPF